MPCKGDAASISWIDTDADLREAVDRWASFSSIGVDTEFQRTDTYFPQPGLYQVAAGDQVYLIDPLAITQWQPFVDALLDESLTKIMHACSEDLELLHHHLGVVPVAVFDTQLANAFSSTDYSASYARLVGGLLGVELEKHSTRSDWLRRPLSERQMEYAWEDVIYLQAIYERLASALDDLGRSQWFADAMVDRGSFVRTPPDQYYLGVKKAWRLDTQALGRLRGLCAWRERQAIAEDVPRKRVVWDEHLLSFAQSDALTEREVAQLLPRGVARRYASDIVREHSALLTESPAAEPVARPLTQSQTQVSKRLREIAGACAASLEVAQELIGRKRDTDQCVRHFLHTGELSDTYRGWRHGLVGGEFRAVLLERL